MRITIQTERLLVVNQGESLYRLCSACGHEVRMITIDQAATLTQISSLEVYREVEAGTLHFLETANGSVLICLNSLIGFSVEISQPNANQEKRRKS